MGILVNARTNTIENPDGNIQIRSVGGTAFSFPTTDGSLNDGLLTNGSGVLSFGAVTGGGAWQLLQTQNASNSTEIDFDLTAFASFDTYRIQFVNLIPITDNQALFLRFSNDGGTTFRSGVSDYRWRLDGSSTAFDDADSEIEITNVGAALKFGNAAGESGAGWIEINDARNTSNWTQILSFASYINGTPVLMRWGTGSVATAEDNDAVRLLMESGNISSGQFSLLGLDITP